MSIEKRPQVILSAGNTSENIGWKAPYGVITLDLEQGAIHIHDGETIGGRHVIRMMDSNDYVGAEQIGKANGVATLTKEGVIPQAQLPTSLTQIKTFGERSLFPAQGEVDYFYFDHSTLSLYTWQNNSYVAVTSEGTLSGYTPKGADALHELLALDPKGLVTCELLAAVLNQVGIYQDGTGQWKSGTSTTPVSHVYHDDTMGADGISHLDTTNNVGLLMRPAAVIHKAFTTDSKYKASNGQEYDRFKYGSPQANWSYSSTWDGETMNENGPMYITSYDKFELGVGIIDCAGSKPDYRVPQYLTLSDSVNYMSLQQLSSSIPNALLAIPVSFGYIDQGEAQDLATMVDQYQVMIEIKGETGDGILYTTSLNADGTAIVLTGRCGTEVVDTVTAKTLKNKTLPFQGILVPKLTKAQAEKAFPTLAITEADGLGYVQLTGDVNVTTMLNVKATNTMINTPIMLTILHI